VDPSRNRGDLWGWGQIFPHGDVDGGKKFPGGSSRQGTGKKLSPHIPRPVDIPRTHPQNLMEIQQLTNQELKF
jgi:hypothetical protein